MDFESVLAAAKRLVTDEVLRLIQQLIPLVVSPPAGGSSGPSNAQSDDVLVVQEDEGWTDRMEIEMEPDLRLALEARRRRARQPRRRQPSRNRICYSCRGAGHLAATCPLGRRIRSVIGRRR